MECECMINVDIDGYARDLCDEWRKARKPHKCYECHRTIKSGEKYKYEVNVYDGEIDKFKTCIDCMSVRDAMFCNFLYGEIWEAVREQVRDGGIPESCLARVTKPAREKICSMIEEYWEYQEARSNG